MSLTPSLKALYEFGVHHVKDWNTVRANMLVMGERPLIVMGGYQGQIPYNVARSNKVFPNVGYDSRTYVIKEPEKSRAFFARCSLVPAWQGLSEDLWATREALLKGEFDTDDGGLKERELKYLLESWYVIADASGTPLVAYPEFRQWWPENFVWAVEPQADERALGLKNLADEGFLEDESTCIVTGDICRPLRLILPAAGIPGTRGSAPVVSYQQQEWRTLTLKRGANFPMALSTARAINGGLEHCIERVPESLNKGPRYGITIGAGPASEDTIMLVPGDGRSSSEVLDRYMPLLGSYPKQEEREAFQALADSLEDYQADSTATLHVLLLRGSKRRLAFLEHQLISEADFVANLRYLRSFTDRPLTTFVKGVAPKKGAKKRVEDPMPSGVPSPLYSRVAFDIITGRPISYRVKQAILALRKNPHNPYHTRWMRVISEQNMEKIDINIDFPDEADCRLATVFNRIEKQVGGTNPTAPFLFGARVAAYEAAYSYHLRLNKDRKAHYTNRYQRALIQGPTTLPKLHTKHGAYMRKFRSQSPMSVEIYERAQDMLTSLENDGPEDVSSWGPRERMEALRGYGQMRVHFGTILDAAHRVKQSRQSKADN